MTSKTQGRRAFIKAGATAVAAVPMISLAAPSTAEPSHYLFDAIARGDIETVKRITLLTPDSLSWRTGSGCSVLTHALLHRQQSIAEYLIKSGYAPDLHESAMIQDWPRFEALAQPDHKLINASHPLGGSAMYAAAAGGAGSDIWRVYAQCGDPNVQMRAGFSPLRAAIDHPDREVAELTAANLLANNAQVDTDEPDGHAPLHAAAARGLLEISEMLIRKGADTERQNDQGLRPIDLAQRLGLDNTVKLLEAHTEIPRDDNHYRRAFTAHGDRYVMPEFRDSDIRARGEAVGAAHRDFDRLREIISKQPSYAHSVATTNEAAVEAGAHMGNRQIVNFLLERGAPYATTTAAMQGDVEEVRRRLREHPNCLNERGAHDFALLWYPVIGESVETLEFILSNGANIEQQHHLGTTSLHFAAMRGNIEIIELLIDHGADCGRIGRKFSPEGHTPAQLADLRGHDAAASLLKNTAGRSN